MSLAAVALIALTVVSCRPVDGGGAVAQAQDQPHTADEPSAREADDGEAVHGSRAPADEADAGSGVAEPADRHLAEPPPDPPRRFTIAATGDILPHDAVLERAAAYGADSGEAYDFRPMFAEVAPVLQAADLAICHLEVPLTTDDSDVYGAGARRTSGGSPLFRSPWQLADALADAGYDACSTAHNHSADAGEQGIVDTLDVLERAGVMAAGTSRSPREAERSRLHEVAGVTVAHLSATYGTNVALPDDADWMVEAIDVDRLLAQARAAREAGAELVVASLHHGYEYQREASDLQRERAERLLGSGEVDLLLGHHAHVVQSVERVDGKVVAHGLGNLLSNMTAEVSGPATEDGVVLLLEVVEDADGGFDVAEVAYVPTWVDRSRHVIVDVGAAIADPDVPTDQRSVLEGSWERTVAGVTRDGADGWGASPMIGQEWLEGRGHAASSAGDGSDDS